MARTRDPARDKAYNLWIAAGGNEAPRGTLKNIAGKLEKSEQQVRKWKSTDGWGKRNVTKKKKSNVTKKAPIKRNVTKTKGTKEGNSIGEKIEIHIEDLNTNDMTEKQRLFCIYYLQSFNARQSALKAGYSATYARVGVYNLLEKASIKEEIERLKKIQAQELHLESNRILNRHAQIAFSDVADYFVTDDEGLRMKSFDEIDGTLIKKITVKKTKREGIESSTEKEEFNLELEDRSKSLDFLTKHAGLDPKLILEREKLEFEKSSRSVEESYIPTSEDTMDKFLPEFKDFFTDFMGNKYLNYVEKGGRGSSKSTHVAMAIVQHLIENPINFLVVRKVANTLELSVFEQIQWAIDYMGVGPLWRTKKSPLEFIYLPRGNRILFRGADKPDKIKSIKSAKFPLAGLWVEELAEFKTEDEVTTIVNSILRDKLNEGLKYKIVFSYNPPKRKQSWVNKKYETQFKSGNTRVHHSDYRINSYISEEFIEEAEEVKRKNPHRYRWEYLGEPIGSGIVPFTNLTFREITDKEVQTFDNIRQGIDWGYSVDPAHFGRWHYDKTRRRLYAIAELHEVKLSNRKLAEWIKKKGYTDIRITADGAEPKSISEMKDHGVTNIRAAKKGPGSIEFGEKWLDDLEEIIIDPKRTPNTAREFENIDYKVDRDGNPKAELEDKDNHSIDTLRYACEGDMAKKETGALKSKPIWV